jgi:hypothetical protein
VRDAGLRADAVTAAVQSIEGAGFDVLAQRDSVLAGPKGNVEVFVQARRKDEPA